MKFTKMQGCGNDYVYVNCFKEIVENGPELAVRVSNRNFGVGSDGLILICPSEVADVKMVTPLPCRGWHGPRRLPSPLFLPATR